MYLQTLKVKNKVGNRCNNAFENFDLFIPDYRDVCRTWEGTWSVGLRTIDITIQLVINVPQFDELYFGVCDK